LTRFWRVVEKGSPPEALEPLENQTVIGLEAFSFPLSESAFADPDGQSLEFSFSSGPSSSGGQADPYVFNFNPQTFEVTATPGGGLAGPGVYRVNVTATDSADGSATAGFDIIALEPGLAEAWSDAYSVFDHWADRLSEIEGANGISLRFSDGGAPEIYVHVSDQGIAVPPSFEFNGHTVPVLPEQHDPQHLVLEAGDNVNGDQSSASLGTLTYPFQRIEDNETVVLTNLHVAAQIRLKTGINLQDFPADVASTMGVPVYVQESGSKVRFGKIDRFDANFWTTLLAEARSLGSPVSPIYDGATVELDPDQSVSYKLPASPLLSADRRCPRSPVHQWDMSGPAVAAMVRQKRALLKFGAVTGTTRGFLSGVGRSAVGISVGGNSHTLDYGDYLLVGKATDPVEIAAKGDSGSLAIFEDSLQPAGILFGANISDPITGGATQYYMQPLQPVLDSLDIRFAPVCPSTISRRYLYYTCPLNRSTLCAESAMFPRADTANNSGDPLLQFNRTISSSASGSFLIEDLSSSVGQITLELSDVFGNSVSIDATTNGGAFVKSPNTHRVGSDQNKTIYRNAWAVILDGAWLFSQGLRVEPSAAQWDAVLTVASGGSTDVLRTKLRISN